MKKIMMLCFMVGLLLMNTVYAKDYPSKPIEMVVAFGPGGSADRLARVMSPYLAEELGVPIRIVNRPGAGTQLGLNYILRAPADGYHIIASTFAPYLTNTIISGGAKYQPSDFAYLNFQWFEKDLIATSKNKPYKSFAEILEKIKSEPGKVSVSVVQGSAGHLMAAILPGLMGLDKDALNIVTYQSGGPARTAVAGGQVDFTIISAQGSESIRDLIRPLAIVSESVVPEWPEALPIKEAVKPLNIDVPVFEGSMRGFAVSRKMAETHPDRFEFLVSALKRTLEKPAVQEALKKNQMEGIWSGPDKDQQLMQENLELFSKYKDVL